MTRRGPSGRERPAKRDRPAWGEQIEGTQAVAELLRARKRKVHRILVAEGSEDSAALAEIGRLAQAAAVQVRSVNRAQLLSTARTDAPQGVVAMADPVAEADLDDLARRTPEGAVPFIVVLDGVTDPHNLGAVMRTAACAGVSGVVVGRHRAVGLTPAAVKAAAGAVEHVPVASVPGIPNALSALSAAGVWTVALDADATGELWDLQVATEPVALVLGSEGKGLSRLARQRCDLAVSIPISGPIRSLNVSAAAALACFEVARRRTTRPD